MGNKEASITLCINLRRLLVPVEKHNCICVAFCICGFVCKWLYTRLIQIVSVLHFVYVDLYANGYIPALYSLLGFSVSVITLVS